MGRILTDIFGEKLQDNELLTTYLNNLSTTDIEEYEDCGNGEREKDSYYKEEDQTIQLNVKEDVDKNCLKRSGTESEGLYRHIWMSVNSCCILDVPFKNNKTYMCFTESTLNFLKRNNLVQISLIMSCQAN